jgi:uncharacterized hydrophobic protein (TIGR00271 family)
VLQVRVVCPEDLTEAVLARLRGEVGAATLSLQRGGGIVPAGDVIICDLARERANAVLEDLHDLGIDTRGAISIVTIDAAPSRRARRAEREAPGHEADALPWDVIEDSARDDAQLATSFLALMALAAVIAAIGIVVDSAVLIIGAMIVGPEYGPLQAIAVGIHRRRRYWRPAALVLLTGLGAAVLAATATGLVVRAVGHDDGSLDPANRFFTSFVTEPNGYSAVVAFAAGVAGTIALARRQATALAGVLVSVTTIPAAAAMGLDLSTGTWRDFAGATIQLGINLVCLLAAGLATLAVYDRRARSGLPARDRPARTE